MTDHNRLVSQAAKQYFSYMTWLIFLNKFISHNWLSSLFPLIMHMTQIFSEVLCPSACRKQITLWTLQLVGMVIIGSMVTKSLLVHNWTKWTVRKHFTGCNRKYDVSLWQPVSFYQSIRGWLCNWEHVMIENISKLFD